MLLRQGDACRVLCYYFTSESNARAVDVCVSAGFGPNPRRATSTHLQIWAVFIHLALTETLGNCQTCILQEWRRAAKRQKVLLERLEKENKEVQIHNPALSGVIRANRFARFARIGWFARIGNSSDSRESAWCAIKNSWRCGNHAHPHKMRKLRPKLRPRRIWTARIQKYCKSVEKRKLRPWSVLPGETQTMVRVNCQNGDGGGSWVGEIGISIANDSCESIRANRVANRLCH